MHIIYYNKNMQIGEMMKILFELFKSFFIVGILTFGGGYAMLPMLEREIVDKHNWVTMDELTNYFAIGQCTPGVIAVNTATFVGYKQKKTLGGIVATLGVITPSVVIILLLSGLISLVIDVAIVKSAFSGISVAVCALMINSLYKLAKTGIKDVYTGIVAIVSALVSVVLKLSPVFIVIVAGIVTVIYKKIIDGKRGGNEQ